MQRQINNDRWGLRDRTYEIAIDAHRRMTGGDNRVDSLAIGSYGRDEIIVRIMTVYNGRLSRCENEQDAPVIAPMIQ